MHEMTELLETGIYESFSPKEKTTVAGIIKELNLEGKYFGILVDGKRADIDTVITPESKLVIIPHKL